MTASTAFVRCNPRMAGRSKRNHQLQFRPTRHSMVNDDASASPFQANGTPGSDVRRAQEPPPAAHRSYPHLGAEACSRLRTCPALA